MNAIETTNLRKCFGSLAAVRGLTLQVKQGEVFGFLGPNGAGKSTSIKMLLGLVRASSGSAQILGSSIRDPKVRAKIGFLPEHFRFHEWLTAREFLSLHGNLYQMDSRMLKQRSADLLEKVGLTPFANSQLHTFSKGMLQRIGLAQALLNYPELVFLDEPTSGLDPVGRRLVRDIIHELRQEGTTVFLNSHLLSEVEITCDRVAFIKHGEVLRTSEIKSLVSGETRVTVRLKALNQAILAGVSAFGSDVMAEENQVHLSVSGEEQIPLLARWLVEQGAEVYAITPAHVSLEDLFIQVVGTDGGL